MYHSLRTELREPGENSLVRYTNKTMNERFGGRRQRCVSTLNDTIKVCDRDIQKIVFPYRIIIPINKRISLLKKRGLNRIAEGRKKQITQQQLSYLAKKRRKVLLSQQAMKRKIDVNNSVIMNQHEVPNQVVKKPRIVLMSSETSKSEEDGDSMMNQGNEEEEPVQMVKKPSTAIMSEMECDTIVNRSHNDPIWESWRSSKDDDSIGSGFSDTLISFY